MTLQQDQIVYSVTQVSRLLGLSRPSVYRALREGTLPSFRLGTKVLVPKAAVERLLEGGAKEEKAA